MIYLFLYLMAGLSLSVMFAVYEEIILTLLDDDMISENRWIAHVVLIIFGPAALLAAMTRNYFMK